MNQQGQGWEDFENWFNNYKIDFPFVYECYLETIKGHLWEAWAAALMKERHCKNETDNNNTPV